MSKKVPEEGTVRVCILFNVKKLLFVINNEKRLPSRGYS